MQEKVNNEFNLLIGTHLCYFNQKLSPCVVSLQFNIFAAVCQANRALLIAIELDAISGGIKYAAHAHREKAKGSY
jgi:hypothetical protein